MSYQINPVNAAINKCKKNGCGINCLSNTCYQICAAFNGAQSNSDIDPQCVKACQQLVESRKEQMYGDEYRMSRRFPQKPPIVDDIPKYFPSLLEKHNNPEVARKMCHKMCDCTKTPNECKEWCDTMADAMGHSPIENYTSERSTSKTNQYIFWIVYFVAGIIFLWAVFQALTNVLSDK